MINIAIVEHIDRHEMAYDLCCKVRADIMFIDHGQFGCEANHKRAWDWHAEHTHDGWAVVLEDDALPVDGFREQLSAALAVAPAPIVSLYLGTDDRAFWQNGIRYAIEHASPGTSWLIAGALLHAVGVAIRSDLLPLHISEGLAVDTAIGNWAKRNSHLIAYTLPSLVDHADEQPIVTQRHGSTAQRLTPRRAHRFGTRQRWTPIAQPIGH